MFAFDLARSNHQDHNVHVRAKLAHTQAAGWIILPHVRATPACRAAWTSNDLIDSTSALRRN